MGAVRSGAVQGTADDARRANRGGGTGLLSPLGAGLLPRRRKTDPGLAGRRAPLAQPGRPGRGLGGWWLLEAGQARADRGAARVEVGQRGRDLAGDPAVDRERQVADAADEDVARVEVRMVDPGCPLR
jgi:hypothetical protein